MCPQNLTNETRLLQILTAFSRFHKVHVLISKDFATYPKISPPATLLFASSIFLIINTSFDLSSLYISPFFCPVLYHKHIKNSRKQKRIIE